jgi:hypothetical protein
MYHDTLVRRQANGNLQKSSFLGNYSRALHFSQLHFSQLQQSPVLVTAELSLVAAFDAEMCLARAAVCSRCSRSHEEP